MLYLPKDFSFVLLTKPISWIIIKNWKKRSAVRHRARASRYHHRVWKRKTYISSYEIIRIVFTTCWKFPRDSNTKWCTIEAFISAFLGLWSFTMLCLIICNEAGTRHIYENCAEIQNVKLLIWKSCFAFSLFFFCFSSYFISRFEMLPSSENPVRLILNHSKHTFSSSEFRLHCGNKRWKSLSSYELCRWDQIKRSGKNHAARIKKNTHT